MRVLTVYDRQDSLVLRTGSAGRASRNAHRLWRGAG